MIVSQIRDSQVRPQLEIDPDYSYELDKSSTIYICTYNIGSQERENLYRLPKLSSIPNRKPLGGGEGVVCSGLENFTKEGEREEKKSFDFITSLEYLDPWYSYVNQRAEGEQKGNRKPAEGGTCTFASASGMFHEYNDCMM